MTIDQVKKTKIEILVLADSKNQEIIKGLQKSWEHFFNFRVTYDSPSNIEKYTNRLVHVLMLDASDYTKFNLEYYKIWMIKSPKFVYVSLVNKREEASVEIYKALVDQILFLDQEEQLLKWNSIAILRRFWNASSKESVVIYREIIADFVEHSIFLNQQKLSLSSKEYEVLKMLIQNRGHFVNKDAIFKKIWHEDTDVSRTLDQVIQRLRKKVGEKYFASKRLLGVKFE